MKRNLSLLVLLVAILLFWYFYQQLGGNSEIQISLEKSEITIVGESYKGNYNSTELEELFLQTRDKGLEEGRALAVVNFGEDKEARTVDQFIGILMDSSVKPHSIPGKIIRVFSSPTMIKVEILSHNMVMPQPEKIREKAAQFADSVRLSLSSTSIEIYRSERALEVYFPANRNQ